MLFFISKSFSKFILLPVLSLCYLFCFICITTTALTASDMLFTFPFDPWYVILHCSYLTYVLFHITSSFVRLSNVLLLEVNTFVISKSFTKFILIQVLSLSYLYCFICMCTTVLTASDTLFIFRFYPCYVN